MQRLSDNFFYSLERAIKTYRQYAQQNLDRHGLDITIDQWLVLKTLRDNPDISLAQVGRDVFKDVASITRIVQLLETKGYVGKAANENDKRRVTLKLTRHGISAVAALEPIIAANRRGALAGVSTSDLKRSQKVFDSIARNCQAGSGK